MKKAYIIGIGMGRSTITARGMNVIKKADLLIGAKRMVKTFEFTGIPCEAEYRPAETADIIRRADGNIFAVLVSGDTGFYSAAAGMAKALSFCSVEMIPGISSMSYFFAKVGIPWQDAVHVSCHGRECNIADIARRNRYIFTLTGGNIAEIAEALTDAGFGSIRILYGENLGSSGERIGETTADKIKELGIGSLAVLLICNDSPDSSVHTGIPDSRFIRGKVPMTKSEVRSVILSRLAIRPDDTVVDVGAGTGSVTVEAALSAWNGMVYAVERNEEGISLIEENCRNFHIGNVKIIDGTAPDALEGIPAPDAAFIGGSGGKMREIVSSLRRMNPSVRIVISAIALESACSAVKVLEHEGLEPEITQISVSRSSKAGKLHLMKAQNSVYIISAGGSDE